MTVLKEIEAEYPNALLNDGAHTWDICGLRDAIHESANNKSPEMQPIWLWDESGIFNLNENGNINPIAAFRFE